MPREFIYQIFTETDGDYDLAVLTDGDVIVPARLTPGTAHVQVNQITSRDGTVAENAVERAVETIEGTLAEEGRVHLVN